MEEVAQTVQAFAREESSDDRGFQDAAEAFAVAALRHYKDGLLTRALAVSRAMVEFLHALEDPELCKPERQEES